MEVVVVGREIRRKIVKSAGRLVKTWRTGGAPQWNSEPVHLGYNAVTREASPCT
jgi:hypothetical protein